MSCVRCLLENKQTYVSFPSLRDKKEMSLNKYERFPKALAQKKLPELGQYIWPTPDLGANEEPLKVKICRF